MEQSIKVDRCRTKSTRARSIQKLLNPKTPRIALTSELRVCPGPGIIRLNRVNRTVTDRCGPGQPSSSFARQPSQLEDQLRQ